MTSSDAPPSTEADPVPVPGRACGACNYCCEHLTIDTPEIQVVPGHRCKNWEETCGCSIYATRPSICRRYQCGWMIFDHFGDEWRPDRSQIILLPTLNRAPEGYPAAGLDFLLVNADAALAQPLLARFIAQGLRIGLPMSLMLRGPAGCNPSSIFLNDELKRFQDDTSLSELERQLHHLVGLLKGAHFQPVQLTYGSSSAPSQPN